MEVNPSKQESTPVTKTTTRWVPAAMAPIIQWTGKVGLTWIQAAKKQPTEFTAQQQGMKDKTTSKTNQLGRSLPYFPFSGKITDHDIEVY